MPVSGDAPSAGFPHLFDSPDAEIVSKNKIMPPMIGMIPMKTQVPAYPMSCNLRTRRLRLGIKVASIYSTHTHTIKDAILSAVVISVMEKAYMIMLKRQIHQYSLRVDRAEKLM